MAEQDTSPERAVRAVVVYRYPVYRDLITRVLEKAEVDVAGALGVKEVSRAALRSLRPDVVVIYDPEAMSLLPEVASPALIDSIGSDVRRVVCVGSDNEMVVLNRLVVTNPSVERLIGYVKGYVGEAGSHAWAGAEAAADQVGRPEQRMTGSGGS